jgi:hypothetical protein
MKFLKIFGLVILGLFLFLSLSIFGVALTMNQTALSPDFVVSEIDNLDYSLMIEDTLRTQPPEEQPSEELITTLVDTVGRVEAPVKEQVDVAVHSIYDYLLGRRQSLDLAETLGDTFLNSEFVASLLDEVDIPALAQAIYNDQITEEIPPEMEYLADHLDEVMIELEPWIKEQAIATADPFFDYLLGESQSLNVVISLEPVMESLHDTLEEAFWASPPPEYEGLPPSVLEQYFDEFFAEFTEMIPSTPEGEHQLEIDETLLGSDIPTEMADALAEAEDGLEQANDYIGYFQLGLKLLIAFILLLILGIVLIYRAVRGSTRQVGSIFLGCGILSLAGFFITKSVAETQIAQSDVSAHLQTWLPQLVDDTLAPLGIYSIVLLVLGVAMLVVSFVYKRQKDEFY